MSDIFFRLPCDVQRLVRSFLPMWQRWGFRREPPPLRPNPLRYYHTIRKPPLPFAQHTNDAWFPSFFEYRRQPDFFQWRVYHDYVSYEPHRMRDYWKIKLTPQWNCHALLSRYLVTLLAAKERCGWFHLSAPFEFLRLSMSEQRTHGSLLPATICPSYGWMLTMTLEYAVSRCTAYSEPTLQWSAEAMVRFTKQLARNVERWRKTVNPPPKEKILPPAKRQW